MASITAVLEDRLRSLASERADLIARAEAAETFDGVRERIDEIDALMPGLGSDLDRARRQAQADRTAPALPGDSAGPLAPLAAPAPSRARPSAQFMASEAWTEYMARIAPGGVLTDKRRIDSPAVPVRGILPPTRRQMATIVTGASSTSAGALVVADDSGILDYGGLQRELTVRDVITVAATGSDAVDFVRVTDFTNAAAATAEADSRAADDTTGLKPESAITFARVSASVKTIAHWIPATKRALADAGQLSSIIDDFLRYGLAEELEDLIVAGNASGENFDGLTHISGTQSETWGTDALTTCRRAKTKVRTAHARANAYLLHPNDWEAIDLELTLGGAQLNRVAAEESPQRLWGLPVVLSEAMPEGTGLVGDFRKAVLWEREAASVQASDGVENFFLKNMVAVLAEMRAAFGVIQPSAFVKIDLGGS